LISIVKEALDLIKFNAMDCENFNISLINDREIFEFHSRIQGLYAAALSNANIKDEDAIIYNLLFHIHYHYLFATSCMMKCHHSEGFASARSAIDAALIAAHIISDRSSQEAYIARKKPFDQLNRHYKDLIKKNKPIPHAFIPTLIQLHSNISSIAVHADIGTFAHRVRFHSSENIPRSMSMSYSQAPIEQSERVHHHLTLHHIFVMNLDIFSEFLINQSQHLTKEWRINLVNTGIDIGEKIAILSEELKIQNSPSQ